MMKAKLRKDIFSFTRPKLRYGKAGDEVTIIMESGNMLIVAAKDTSRFPVRREFVEIKKVNK